MLDPNRQYSGIDRATHVRDVKLVIDDFTLYDKRTHTVSVYIMHDCAKYKHLPVGNTGRGVSQGTDVYTEFSMSSCVRCHEPIPEEMQALYHLYVSGLSKEIQDVQS